MKLVERELEFILENIGCIIECMGYDSCLDVIFPQYMIKVKNAKVSSDAKLSSLEDYLARMRVCLQDLLCPIRAELDLLSLSILDVVEIL